MDGYITSFTSFRSNAGNEGFDLKFQISPTNNVTVKIMKSSNQYISDSYLNNFRQAGNPLSIRNLNRGSNGVYLFNSNRGSKFQNSSNVDFVYNPNKVLTVKEMKQEPVGEVNFIASVKWLFESQQVGEKILREGLLTTTQIISPLPSGKTH